uniref:Uncharacterized protein n=1 Tax=Arundo donax TaxID=35708 RepID=A0A0A9AF64_ARUDO
MSFNVTIISFLHKGSYSLLPELESIIST